MHAQHSIWKMGPGFASDISEQMGFVTFCLSCLSFYFFYNEHELFVQGNKLMKEI